MLCEDIPETSTLLTSPSLSPGNADCGNCAQDDHRDCQEAKQEHQRQWQFTLEGEPGALLSSPASPRSCQRGEEEAEVAPQDLEPPFPAGLPSFPDPQDQDQNPITLSSSSLPPPPGHHLVSHPGMSLFSSLKQKTENENFSRKNQRKMQWFTDHSKKYWPLSEIDGCSL